MEHIRNAIDPWEELGFDQDKANIKDRIRILLTRLYFWSNKQVRIRYQPIIKEIESYTKDNKRILEVGSGRLGLSLYTRRRIIGIDVKTAGRCYPNMTLVNANAINLPFKDDSFDLVCSVDLLEHLPKDQRYFAVSEMCRVSRKKVIIGTPCGETAELWEEKARNLYFEILNRYSQSESEREMFVRRNRYLFEHCKYDLPEDEEVISLLGEYSRTSSTPSHIGIIGNESVYVWYLGTLGNMKYNLLRWSITTVILILFFPICSKMSIGGFYRKISILEKLNI